MSWRHAQNATERAWNLSEFWWRPLRIANWWNGRSQSQSGQPLQITINTCPNLSPNGQKCAFDDGCTHYDTVLNSEANAQSTVTSQMANHYERNANFTACHTKRKLTNDDDVDASGIINIDYIQYIAFNIPVHVQQFIIVLLLLSTSAAQPY